MIEFDGRALLMGVAAGVPASILYFAGLAWSTRRALRARRPALLLLASFLLRAGLLLGLAFWLVRQAQPLWMLAGFLAAFVLVRTAAIRGARAREPLDPLATQEP